MHGAGSDYDLNGNTSTKTGDGEKVKDFRDVAWNSVAFVASDEKLGWMGDNDRAATARDSFIISYNKDLGNDWIGTEAHNGVVQVFTDMLNKGVKGLSNYERNRFGNRGGVYDKPKDWSHEGVINAVKNSNWGIYGNSAQFDWDYKSGSSKTTWI
jgi:hypothetical protein